MASDFNVKRCTLVIEIECGGSYGTNQVIKERNALSSLYIHKKWVLKVWKGGVILTCV